jgi:4,5-dihydroxyphthalate decarboxylase
MPSRRDVLRAAATMGATALTGPALAAAETSGPAGVPRLTFGCALYDRMVPLYTGEVKPQGIDLNFAVNYSPRDIFDRMARGLDYDASEMSISEFIARKAANQCPFVAIPVFPSRVFRHGHIAINRRAGIREPKDLAGKRIGVPLYTMTAAVFIRGLLQHEYGVDLSTIRWVQGALDKPSVYGEPDVMPLVKPVAIEQNQSAKSLSDLLAAGEIDATIGSQPPPSLRTHPNDVQLLFSDYRSAEMDYYRRTRIFPIMHVVLIQERFHDRHPHAAASLYEALSRSKDIALKRMKSSGTPMYMLPWMKADIAELDTLFGSDPWPYGVEPNRPTLDALMTYMADQGLIAKKLPIDELFLKV